MDDDISEVSDIINIEENIDSDIEEGYNVKNIIIENNIDNNIEDINVFNKNYESLKKKNITNIYLNKYEITKI